MSGAAILRKRVRSGFTQIPNTVLRDPSLSFKAVGVLAHILSLPNGAPVSAETLAEAHREGRSAVLGALRELTAAGFYRVDRERGERGKFVMVVTVTDTKGSLLTPEAGFPTPDYPTSDNPGSDEPTSENLPPSNKYLLEKEPPNPRAEKRTAVLRRAAEAESKKGNPTNPDRYVAAIVKRLEPEWAETVDRWLTEYPGCPIDTLAQGVTDNGKLPARAAEYRIQPTERGGLTLVESKGA